jgi:hypothetical protein
MAYRASQLALAAIRRSGKVALDYLDESLRTGERAFTTSCGERLQITVVDDFMCLHLEGECAHVTTCPKTLCHKLKWSAGIASSDSSTPCDCPGSRCHQIETRIQ